MAPLAHRPGAGHAHGPEQPALRTLAAAHQAVFAEEAFAAAVGRGKRAQAVVMLQRVANALGVKLRALKNPLQIVAAIGDAQHLATASRTHHLG